MQSMNWGKSTTYVHQSVFVILWIHTKRGSSCFFESSWHIKKFQFHVNKKWFKEMLHFGKHSRKTRRHLGESRDEQSDEDYVAGVLYLWLVYPDLNQSHSSGQDFTNHGKEMVSCNAKWQGGWSSTPGFPLYNPDSFKFGALCWTVNSEIRSFHIFLTYSQLKTVQEQIYLTVNFKNFYFFYKMCAYFDAS